MSKKSPKKPKKSVTKSVSKKQEVIAQPSVLPSFWKNHTSMIGVLAVLAITFACFYNTLDHKFVNWDDDKNFYENELVTTISSNNFWSNTKEIFSSTVIGNYNPLTIWTFAIEKQMYGLDATGKWHLTNVLLHLICVFFIFRICLLLGLSWRGAVFVALLFGIHPMRVESVAWVTERKDVLFGSFYLAGFYQYIKGKLRGKINHKLIILLFILSLFSKIQAVILPLSMIAVDYYLSGKITKKDIISKWPYFLLSLLFGVVGILFLKDQGSLDNAATYPQWQRFFVGSFSYLIYLAKSIFPWKMLPMYPYAPSMPGYFYPTILAGPAVLYGLYYTYKNDLRVWFFGLAFFTVNIMFLLQVLGAGQGFLADRFTYIAYFGLFFIAGYFLDKYTHESNRAKLPIIAVSALAILAYAYMTTQQNKVWTNSETLWSHVIKYESNSTLPYGNRANYLREQNRVDEALEDYAKVVSLDPNAEQAYNSRARLYFDNAKTTTDLQNALENYNQAIRLAPNNGEFYVNRGATYARLGDITNAIKDMTNGINIKPDHAVGYLNRSVMYNQQGNYPKALEDIESYLKLSPYNADMWYEKGRLLRTLNQLTAAIPAYDQAIKIKDAERINQQSKVAKLRLYYYERGRTKYFLQQMDSAKQDIQMAANLGMTDIDPEIKSALGIR